ncbi:hypothetical protein IM676_01700 [Anabaenopsis elenkinii CCIBt3563]|uniref:Uncharacterized protein n=2 Tax=Anabaenopsis TaxID=110103 RepID=A0A7S6U2J0_9CYAN|nr:hypothetical protein IM676_01700 [Anabaenopsis elenkinii CCIBt3563]
MKWNLNDQGRLYATWVNTEKLPDCWKNDEEMLQELWLVHNLYAALDAVFMNGSQVA